MNNWKELVEKYRKEAGLKTDAEVAAGLGITKQKFSDFLNDRQDLSTGAKFALIDQISFITGREAILSVFPESAQSTVRKAMQSVFYKHRIEKSLRKDLSRYEEIYLSIDSILEYEDADDVIDAITNYIKEKKKITGKD